MQQKTAIKSAEKGWCCIAATSLVSMYNWSILEKKNIYANDSLIVNCHLSAEAVICGDSESDEGSAQSWQMQITDRNNEN